MAFGGVHTVHALQKPRLRRTPLGITQEEAVEGNIWSCPFETPVFSKDNDSKHFPLVSGVSG